MKIAWRLIYKHAFSKTLEFDAQLPKSLQLLQGSLPERRLSIHFPASIAESKILK